VTHHSTRDGTVHLRVPEEPKSKNGDFATVNWGAPRRGKRRKPSGSGVAVYSEAKEGGHRNHLPSGFEKRKEEPNNKEIYI